MAIMNVWIVFYIGGIQRQSISGKESRYAAIQSDADAKEQY